MRASPWRVATGHPETTQAAAGVLRAGGNAFDAAVAATLAACVAEPVLCSLGGGGHALIKPAGRAPLVLDFFAQTPGRRRLEGLEFYPITGDFGPDTQEFHIGMGSVAVPGMVAGLWALNRRYGSLSMDRLTGPARELARAGTPLNATQAYALRILEPIVRASEDAARLFGLAGRSAPLPEPGTRVHNHDLAEFLGELAEGGPELFYRGEAARRIAAESGRHGGHLALADLERYRERWRRPLSWRYRRARLWSNPPPAFGGLMVALTTGGLETRLEGGVKFGSDKHLAALCGAMAESEVRRRELEQPEHAGSTRSLMAAWRTLSAAELMVRRGTTQISILDAAGNGVSLTISNGEGCGRVVPGLGFMLNNMLGEEDLNRAGFHRWPVNRRLASMMAPTLLEHAGLRTFFGSGGSNRIRTALTQVVSNLVDFGMSLAEAVRAPRLHLEGGRLAIETLERAERPGAAAWLDRRFPRRRRWPEPNLYFGGVHAVNHDEAVADSRRGGAALSG